jgi:S-adenosylmethionine/arginine decarboxylase-like enzyme
MFPLLEVGRNIIDQTLIHDTALVHQDEAIKRIENFRRRLMNSANRAQLKIVELVFQDFGQQEGTTTTTTTTCVCLREQY